MGIRKIRCARRAALFATFVAFALATCANPTPALAKFGSKYSHPALAKSGSKYSRPAHKADIRKGARPHGRASGPANGHLLGYALAIRPHYVSYAPRRYAYPPRFRAHYSYRPLVRQVYGRTCHTVSKTGYDGYGRKAKIGGTMCYDSYGNSYVVKGSRYVIHYY